MARDFIKVDRTTTTATHAQKLLAYVSQWRGTYELGLEIKAIMDHNTDASVWTDIEALFGVGAGKGQSIYNLVSGSVAAMGGSAQSGDGKTMSEQVG
jgi:hypothetical protein